MWCLLLGDKSPLGFQVTGFTQRWKGVDFVERGDSDLKLSLSSSHSIDLDFLVFQLETAIGIQLKLGFKLKQCRVGSLHCLIRKRHQFKHPI